MTHDSVPDSTPVPQTSPFSSPLHLGRRAFGRQRRMSPQTLARNIAESILKHRQLGQHRPISFYTANPELQALVLAQLDGTAVAAK
jgi:hypothetical protein